METKMKKNITLLVICFFMINAQAATAVYYSSKQQSTYRKTKQATQEIAENKAKKLCASETDDCEILATSSSPGYGAIAVGRKSLGVQLAAQTKKEAIQESLKTCQSQGDICEVTVTWYDPIPAPPPPPPQQVEQQCYSQATGLPIVCGALYDANGRSIYSGKLITEQH
jgi:hypothetical protein